jgi:hypothetical protein
LYEIDPSSTLGNAPVDEHGALVFSDQTMGDAGSKDAVSQQEESVPPVQYYYRIDGTAKLTRSRFLHLDLDIELREPLYEQFDTALVAETAAGLPGADSASDAPDTGTIPAGTALLPAETVKRTGAAADAAAFRIHRIAQKRQVKTEQMEYFDGPVIGLLVLVTGFDAKSDDLGDDPGDTPGNTLGETLGDTMEPEPAL